MLSSLQKGFEACLTVKKILPYEFRLAQSVDFAPANIEYQDETSGCRVKIQAGMASIPSDDDVPGMTQRPEADIMVGSLLAMIA